MSLGVLMLAVLVLLLVIDWRQTLIIARPGGWHERNPVLAWLIDRSPKLVHGYFALCIAAVLLAAWLLRDEPVALAWLSGIAALLQAVPVLNNHRIGIRI